MYETFYGLREKPFSILPDPSYLCMLREHHTALTMLRYSLASGQGFTVITGEVGCGKTTLVNQLISEIGDDVNVGLINFTQSEYKSLIEWVMMAYGLDYKQKSSAEHYDDFVNFLIDQYAAGRRTVLIIDEAQNMGLSGLENIRMLSNVNARQDYLLHLILVGQPELKSLLSRPELRQLAQRVSVAYHLGRLSPSEVLTYVHHRLTVAGGDPELFDLRAIQMIEKASGGLPRVINTICDMALVYGFSEGKKQIDAALMKAVLEDRQQMGLAPSRSGPREISEPTIFMPDKSG